MISPALAVTVCRFGLDASALLVWGASAYLAWFVPGALAAAVLARIEGWVAAAVTLSLVATLARLPAEVASIGDGWRDGVDATAIGGVLWDSSVGQAWAAQAAAASLLVLVQAAPRSRRVPATALASGLVLVTLTLTGHAVMHDGLLGALHRANDAVHVLTAGAWFGALWPVSVILCLGSRCVWRVEAGAALKTFSRAGHIIVGLVLVSGAANTALVLRRWPTDLSEPYQVLLDAKILSVAVMVGLALMNRYVLVPRLGTDPAAVVALRRATLAEVVLGSAAIALVGIFGALDPT